MPQVCHSGRGWSNNVNAILGLIAGFVRSIIPSTMVNMDMKEHINTFCDLWLRTLRVVLEKDYANSWSDAFNRLYVEQAKMGIQQLNLIFRCDPAFQIREDLSNIMERGYLPGTDSIGKEIEDIVLKRFRDYRNEWKAAKARTQ